MDIDIFKFDLSDIDIDIFKNYLIDIDIFKNDLIDIDIFQKCRYIDNRYFLSIYRTGLLFTRCLSGFGSAFRVPKLNTHHPKKKTSLASEIYDTLP